MICRRLLCVGMFVVAVACTHDEHHACTRLDGGACTAADAATATHDASSMPPPEHDAATRSRDAGAAGMDAANAGHSAADGGTPAHDAATHDDDSGQPAADSGTHADDDAGTADRDGTYTCEPLQNFAYDCVDPWLDGVFQRPDGGGSAWTLQLANGQLSLDSYGFDQAQISCTGSWSGDEFTCAAQWSRAGRVCDNALHLRAQPDGSLLFSVAMRLEELASCHK